MSAATWDDLGPEARVLRDVMRSRAFGAVSAVAGRKFQVPPPVVALCHCRTSGVADRREGLLTIPHRSFPLLEFPERARRSDRHTRNKLSPPLFPGVATQNETPTS